MEQRGSGSLSVSLRYWLVIAGLTPLWIAAAEFAGPWAIGQLHAGRGPGFLLERFGGRASTPLANYLAVWDGVTRQVSVLAVFGVLVGYVALRLYVATRAPLVPDGEGFRVAKEAGGGLGASPEREGSSATP